MATSRIWKIAVLGIALLAASIAAAAEATHIRLELHWDRDAGVSKAVVKNSAGEALAEATWDGALPRAYACETDESEVPTFIVGQLRDQLQQSSHLDADRAWAFVRGLMGEQGDTPVSQLSTTAQTWISHTGGRVAETCGTVVDANGECSQPASSQLTTTFCSESACKVTKIFDTANE